MRESKVGARKKISAYWPGRAGAGGLGWRPRLEAALSSIWRWRGLLEGELADARPTPLGGRVPHVLAPVVSTPWPPEPLAPPLSVPGWGQG